MSRAARSILAAIAAILTSIAGTVLATPACKPAPAKVLVVSNFGGEAAGIASNFQSRMPGLTFGSYDARTVAPSLALLNQYDVVLLYENGLFGNAPNVGNAVHSFYSQGNKGVVLGIFFWQDLSDSPQYPFNYGWGNLEAVVPLVNSSGYEYNPRSLNPATIVPHAITLGVSSVATPTYAGGLRAAPGTTVLGYWNERNLDGSLDPAVGIKEQFGSRIAGISLFPAMPGSGNWYELWRNALTWAAFGSECTPATPEATDDVFNTDEDTALSVPAPGVLANDNGGTITATLTQPAANGTVVLNANGSFVYTPNANFVGVDTFRYRISNATASGNEARVQITVASVNDVTVAENDAYATDEDVTLSVSALQGVLANDTDPDAAEILTAELVDAPANATSFILNPNGSFTYVPTANFNGSDTFTYRVKDKAGAYSNKAMATIQVRPVNDAPIAMPDNLSTSEDVALSIAASVLASNDSPGPGEAGQHLAVTAVGSPVRGVVTLAGGVVTFVPDPNFHGPASFAYTVCDDGTPQLCAQATANILVTPVNDPPVALPDAATTAEDVSVTIAVLANDSDIDGPTLSVASYGQGANGTVTCGASSCTYTPHANFHGSDVFTYTVADGAGGLATAAVTITVTPVNDAPGTPSLSTPPAAVPEGSVAVVGVSFLNVDAGDVHTATVDWGDGTVESFSLGTATFFGPTHRYADDNASDSYLVTVTITDAAGLSSSSSITVRVGNMAPILTSVTGPAGPVAAGAPVSVAATFTDVGVLDTHTCTFSWGDGTSTTAAAAGGACSASHSYAASNVYEVAVTVSDDDGGSATDTFRYVVVYDAAAGFVTGGGWFNSPAGAYAPDPVLAGKATFGFVSKYKPGQSVPAGNTEFQFKAASLSFRSTSYDWMVISGQKARYRGVGTINGAGAYSFELTAWDGDTDRIRLQIWDANRGNAVVYDNELGKEPGADPTTALGGGSIQIHR